MAVASSINAALLCFTKLYHSLNSISMCLINCFNNNAKACYDKIITLFAPLCSKCFGFPATALDFLLHFLRTLEYHFCTCYRTSAEFNSIKIKNIYKVLQGSVSVLFIWYELRLVLIKLRRISFQQMAYLTLLEVF